MRNLGKFLEDFLTRYYGKFLAKNAYLHINAINIFEEIHPLVYDKLLVIYIYIYPSIATNFIY